MYRCTECNAEYEQCPDFCDCGNDTFEEVYEETYEEEYYEPEPEPVRHVAPKKRLTPEEAAELEREKVEKKKSMIAAGVIAVLCLFVFVLPPHKKAKKAQIKENVAVANVKIPDVGTYWDKTVPSAFKAKDPIANLPLLNERFRSISPVLREYIVNIGNEFNRKWDTSIIQGSGECKVQYVVDKEGNLSSKTIVSSSHNESLDNSVLLALSNVNSFDIPPDDYKGERVYITFKVDANNSSSVKYPMK